MKIFMDSSAFAKRYIDEAGSDEIEKICSAASQIGLSIICLPEIMSAFNRRLRENSISESQYKQAKKTLIKEVMDTATINLSQSIITTTTDLLENNRLRVADALHVSCALSWPSDLFVSSEKKQISAAKKSGLKTRYIG